MPKRKNSSIKEYKLKSGAKRYYFKISLGTNSNGKRIVTTRRGFKSYAEAEDQFNRMSQTKADDFVKQKQIKVIDLWKIWFEHYKDTVKDSTANKTEINYKCHVDPYFGQNYIDNISVKDLQLWADKLATELVKYRDVLFIMRSLYEYGMRLGYVLDNPVNRIIVPKKTSRKRRDVEHNVYTKKELDAFLEVAKQVSPRVYAYFRLLSSTGLRKGEALALTWKDIDLINDTITINKTLAYGLNNKPVVNTPKTKTSARTVPMSANLKQALLDYRKSEAIVSNKIFHTRAGKYVSLAKGNQWLNEVYSKDHEINEQFAKENKLDESYVQSKDLRHITSHGFRHTFATLMIENGARIKTVQMLLGHSNVQMTLDIYTHITEKNKDDAIESIKQLNL